MMVGWKRWSRRDALVMACAAWVGGLQAAPVGAALDRPAVLTRRAPQAVLQAATAAGSRLVAVGERGIVLLSDDNGTSWRQAPTPTSVGLTAVQFVDAEHGWAVGHGGVVLHTQDGGRTWQKQFDGVQVAQSMLTAAEAAGDERSLTEARRWVDDGPDKPFLALHFFDRQTGWVVGAFNLAFFTADGGVTWQSVSARLDNPKQLHLYALRVQGDVMLLAGEQGLVLLSRDRGQTFQRLSTPYRGSFFTAEIAGDGDFVVAGLRGNAWRSRDGGGSWRELPGGPRVNITGSARSAAGQVMLASQAGLLLAVDGDQLKVAAGDLKLLNGVWPLPQGRWLALTFDGPTVVNLGQKGAAK